jgi:hypothetical protein
VTQKVVDLEEMTHTIEIKTHPPLYL